MKQTAVEWLFEKLWDEPKDKFTWYALRKKAIEMEKEQMEKCYDHATLAFLETGDFEDYFNKIYGGEK
jgi:hypothetical protein